MLELYPYLKRVYEDQIIDCMMCREIAIRVSICEDLYSFGDYFLFKDLLLYRDLPLYLLSQQYTAVIYIFYKF